MIIATSEDLDSLDFSRSGGLVPVIAQHVVTGEVLMLGFGSRESFQNTLREGVLWFYSRSRKELWRKGETSGNSMHVTQLFADCDRDAVVALVDPAGPACHTGARTCFGAASTLTALADTIEARAAGSGDGSYTRRLLGNANLRAKKLGEEAVELALACAAGDRAAIADEAADLLFHALVACSASGVSIVDVLRVLERRSERGM
ncbi:MAG: bifunctional phosphoribosyl-AMP cyclohydrolase/phosphoribosyl-ATP diphosphatase HisIE [Longimicrobiales bacterium]